MSMSLSLFTINIIGGNESFTNALYANGNQQVVVAVNVQKLVNSVPTPLSSSEVNSVTVVEYSSNINAGLPVGWFCDTTQNRYDQGLRGSSFRVEASAVPATRAAADVVSRYMRCDSRVNPLQNYQFMARIRLDDGTVYTTHFDDGGGAVFESKITIAPQRPYVITADEMNPWRDDAYNTEWQKDDYIDVDVYYWTLPSSLKIYDESFSNAGYWTSKLYYAAAINYDSSTRLIFAIRYTVTSLTLGDIGNLPNSGYAGTQVSLSHGDGLMRAARYLCDSHSCSPTYNNYLYWTITDNLGCVSRFTLKANNSDNGNTLTLGNA
ncbi:hypothetical protein [Tistrella mobilis]|uniref:hypothetical protein n=1 Tax=Tistrella mobilis TaxID=171437 RepID=UPI0035588469